MSITAAHKHASQARDIYIQLKETLANNQEPWSREIEDMRRKLRRQYLYLLLLHPNESESVHVETLLWMQTSHTFISKYKERITRLNNILQNGGNNVSVERRKIMNRFQQFLAEEEKFWQELVLRLYRAAPLDEAKPALVELGILASLEGSLPDPDTSAAAMSPPNGNHNNNRHNFQFFPDETLSVVPVHTPSDEEQQKRLSMLGKALVCLGDIARYREQYNEGGGRPLAGTENVSLRGRGAARGGRGRGRGAAAATAGVLQDISFRPRNYTKADNCYTQAQLLVPFEGNPAHQRAILASYQQEKFTSVYHYYRALCVRHPYDTAGDNLDTVLRRAADEWSNKGADPLFLPDDAPPHKRARRFKDTIVVYQAFAQGVFPGDASALSNFLADDLKDLVSRQILPPNLILQAVVIAQGSLWRRHIFRTPSTTTTSSDEAKELATFHLLALIRSLLEASTAQIRSQSSTDINTAAEGLAARITPELKRTLPALRLASKWLHANEQMMAQTEEDARRRRSRNRRGAHTPSRSAEDLKSFWTAYVEFLCALDEVFPEEERMKWRSGKGEFVGLLKEDVEVLRGFAPLKKLGIALFGEGAVATGVKVSTEHPNDQNVMRVTDLIEDARAIAESEKMPVVFDEKAKTFALSKSRPDNRDNKASPLLAPPDAERNEPGSGPGSASTSSHSLIQNRSPLSVHQSESAEMTASDKNELVAPAPVRSPSRVDSIQTEDDPVLNAVREVVDDEEEDKIVWDLHGLPPSSPKHHLPVQQPSFIDGGSRQSLPSFGDDAVPHRSSPLVPAISPPSAAAGLPGKAVMPRLEISDTPTPQQLFDRLKRPRAPSSAAAAGSDGGPTGMTPLPGVGVGVGAGVGRTQHRTHLSTSSLSEMGGMSPFLGTSIWSSSSSSSANNDRFMPPNGVNVNTNIKPSINSSSAAPLPDRVRSVMPPSSSSSALQQMQAQQHQAPLWGAGPMGAVAQLDPGRSEYRGVSVPPQRQQQSYIQQNPSVFVDRPPPLGRHPAAAGSSVNESVSGQQNAYANSALGGGLRRDYRFPNGSANMNGLGGLGFGYSATASPAVRGDLRTQGAELSLPSPNGGFGVATFGGGRESSLLQPSYMNTNMNINRPATAATFGLGGMANGWGRVG